MTMSDESGFVDTNVLVYAMDADATQHAAASAKCGARFVHYAFRDISDPLRILFHRD
jgi:predicted nucleic acid-binding protein